MRMDINDIALDMDYGSSRRHLTLHQAVKLLLSKASKKTRDSLFIPVLAFEEIIRRFSNGGASIAEVREWAELLAESADDVAGLITSILMRDDIDVIDYDDNAVVLMQDNRYKSAAYQLSESIMRWNDKEITDDELIEYVQAFYACARAALHNVSLFEANVGGNFRIKRNNNRQSAPAVYDNTLFESVSTGAIAIRPAALGTLSTSIPMNRSGNSGKRRWYLRYVIDRQ